MLIKDTDRKVNMNKHKKGTTPSKSK
jgi:hypothetical protein